jgi:TRAP-type uncharacterized transport system fused permease subunit
MVYSPGVLLQGSGVEIALDILVALAAVMALVPALEGHQFTPVRPWERLAFAVCVVLLFLPAQGLQLFGLGLIATLVLVNLGRARRGAGSAREGAPTGHE